jgi:hypothetical protein
MANRNTTKTQITVKPAATARTIGTVIVTNWTGSISQSDLDFAKQVGGDPRDWR